MSYLLDGIIVRVTWLMRMKVICKLYCTINVSNVIVHNNNCNLSSLGFAVDPVDHGKRFNSGEDLN